MGIADRADHREESHHCQIGNRRQEGEAPGPRFYFGDKIDERLFQENRVGKDQPESKGEEGDVRGKVCRDIWMQQGGRIDSQAEKEQKSRDEGKQQVACFLFHCFVNVRYTAMDVYSWRSSRIKRSVRPSY